MTTTVQKVEETKKRPCVVIVGGGFGGLNAAKALGRADVDVFLIDRENFHLFQPLLYQVATAGLAPGDIASPIRSVVAKRKNIRVMLGAVEKIDREKQTIYFDRQKVSYDYLILAAGVETNYFGNTAWETIAPGLKTLSDALECRRRILSAFEKAEWSEDESEIESLLTFVVVGAGATGVEMAGAIGEIAHEVMVRDFRKIDPAHARIVLLDAAPRVLMGYDEVLSERAKQDLEKMGVEVRLNAMVDEITADGVRIGDDFIASQTVIWAAGVKASPLAQSLDTELDRMGRVVVDRDLTVPGDERVFVIGDLAHAKRDDGSSLPGLAPVAIQQGKHVAKNIQRAVKGEAYQDFDYTDRGQMATIGKAKAIAQVGKRHFTGFLAWMMWLVIHLLFLIGFRNKVFVVLDWFYAYLGSRRGARLIMETPQVVRSSMPSVKYLPLVDIGDETVEILRLDGDDEIEAAVVRGNLGDPAE